MADGPSATMRDRGAFWTPVPDWTTATIARAGFSARRVSGLGQTLVSGNVEAGLAALAPGAVVVGLWAIADEGAQVVRMARDRALIVTPAPLGVAPGWNAAGYVATPCEGAWAVLELSGEGARDVVAEATAADLDAGSRSASASFAGLPVLLYRIAPATVRLHVESPLATYLWTWLQGAGQGGG